MITRRVDHGSVSFVSASIHADGIRTPIWHASLTDHSPIVRRPGMGPSEYDSRCSYCYLGMSHTVELHAQTLEAL